MQKRPSREEQIARLKAMSDEEIDFSDIPEVEDWSGAVRGLYFTPGRQVVAVPLPPELLSWLEAQDGGASATIERLVREAAARAA